MPRIRLMVAALLFLPAIAQAAPKERPAPLSESMRSGLAGLAAWEAASYPSTPALPRRTPVAVQPRTSPPPTEGLAGLAAWEAAAYFSPSPSARPAERNATLSSARSPRMNSRPASATLTTPARKAHAALIKLSPRR